MIPDALPELSKDAHKANERKVCAMEAAAWLAAEQHSDHPACVHPVIAQMGRTVNDHVDDATRQTLWPLIMRSMGTASDDQVLSVRLAIWCARQVLPIFEAEHPDDLRPRSAIEAAEAWADCPCDDHAADAAYAANAAGTTYAAYAAYDAAAYAATVAACDAAANAATVAAYAGDAAANAAYAGDAAYADLPALWSGLLDEYDRLTGRTEAPAPSRQDWDRLIGATK